MIEIKMPFFYVQFLWESVSVYYFKLLIKNSLWSGANFYFTHRPGAVHKWRHGLRGRGFQGFCDNSTKVLLIESMTMGRGGVKNYQKLRDVIYGRPLVQIYLATTALMRWRWNLIGCSETTNWVFRFLNVVETAKHTDLLLTFWWFYRELMKTVPVVKVR